MTEKRRIDQLLVERGLAESRARSASAGDGRPRVCRRDARRQARPAGSRRWPRSRCAGAITRGSAAAGVKLAHAIEHFGLDPKGAVAMDIGSSTGGFTEVLLANGAAHVFAVDVGTNQLAWKLRQDPRVTVARANQRPCAHTGADRSRLRLGWCATPRSSASPKCSRCR
jgi:23S rRNA (cytidine1920-2'-O)/16S rRNA (cytidine1409-2'-O)-methyltransferase